MPRRNNKSELNERLKEVLKKQNKILRLINRTLLKQQKLVDKSRKRCECDIIKWMDGSIYFWLYVVEMAKRDFIAYYNNESKWNVKVPIGKIWVSAYAFLFRDDYRISLNVEQCKCCSIEQEEVCKTCKGRGFVRSKNNQNFSLQDILDICDEACKSRKINSSVTSPSVKKIRELLVKDINDDWLTQKINNL